MILDISGSNEKSKPDEHGEKAVESKISVSCKRTNKGFELLHDKSKENLKNGSDNETNARRYSDAKLRREIANGEASGLLDRDSQIEVLNIEAGSKRISARQCSFNGDFCEL